MLSSAEVVRSKVFLAAFSIWVAFSFHSPASAFELPDDPYQNIVEDVLPNGLHVVYSPNDASKTFHFQVMVNAGFASETSSNEGVSHLLEHYLFTDGRLEKNMSYLEVIQEKGGVANGQTEEMGTTFFATLPHQEAEWTTQLFYKMLFNRKFNSTDFELVKKPVLLEIGNPEPLAPLLASGVMKIVAPSFLREPDFWESEFGIYHERGSHARESLNTIAFQLKDVESYYRQYYHPSNITIYLSGKFDVKKLRTLVDSTFGSVADWKGEGLHEQTPHYRSRPYVRSTSTAGTPFITLGTKVVVADAEEEAALRIYLEYLSHRLTKEIRNEHGDTYSVRHQVMLRENFGVGYLMMEAPAERYTEILHQVKDRMQDEARDGKLTPSQFEEAMSLYSTHFKLTDPDSGTLYDLARSLHDHTRIFGKRESSYDAFKVLKYDSFKAHLSKLFAKQNEYSSLSEPPIWFRLESFFLDLLSVSFFFFAARRFFKSDFEHARIRWVRKLALPPIYIAEFVAISLSLFLSSYAYRAFNLLALQSNFIQSNFVLSNYVAGVFSWCLILGGYLFGCSLLIRKAIVSGDYLYLKSMTYGSIRLPLAEIDSFEKMSLLQVITSPKTLGRMKWRFHFMDFCFWRPGTLIHLKNGKSYFVGVRRSDQAVDELTAMLPRLEEVRYWGEAA